MYFLFLIGCATGFLKSNVSADTGDTATTDTTTDEQTTTETTGEDSGATETSTDSTTETETNTETETETNTETETETETETSSNCVVIDGPYAPDDATSVIQDKVLLLSDGDCLEFTTGDYAFHITESIDISGKQNILIEGNQSIITLFGYDASQKIENNPPLFDLQNSSSVELRNLSILSDRPNHIFAQVTSDNGNPADGNFTVDPGAYTVTPSLLAPNLLYIEHLMQWTDAATPGAWERFANGSTVTISNSMLQVVTNSPQEPTIGDYILLMHNKKQKNAIDISDSQSPMLSNILFGNVPGIAIYGTRVTDLQASNLTTQPHSQGQISVESLITIEGANGALSLNNLDSYRQIGDIVHLSSPRTKISYGGASGNVYAYDYADGAILSDYVSNGDTLGFYDFNFQLLGTGLAQGSNGMGILSDSNHPSAQYIVPMKWSNATISIQNAHVTEGRSRFVLKSSNVHLHDCSSSYNAAEGIVIPEEGFNSSQHGSVDNILIENCTFDQVALQSGKRIAAIYVGVKNSSNQLLTETVHSQIEIRNNILRNLPQAGILVHGTQDITVSDNQFENIAHNLSNMNPYNQPPYDAGNYDLYFAHCSDIIMSNNTTGASTASTGCVGINCP